MRTIIALLLLAMASRAFADVTVLSHRCDKHPWGAARLIGEIRNDGPGVIKSLRVIANFRTANGLLIESASGYGEIRPLLVGQSTGFHVTGPENPAYASCEFAAIHDGFSGQLPAKLAPKPPAPEPAPKRERLTPLDGAPLKLVPKANPSRECPKQINRKYYVDCNGAMIEGTAPD